MEDELLKQEPKILIPEVRIQSRVAELAQEINHDFRGREIVAVCILKGSFVFFTDVIRHLEMPIVCDFLGVSNYTNRKVVSGEVKLTLDVSEPLENKHVIVFEDVVDSGLTLNFILNTLRARKPASLKTCSLLVKEPNLKTEVDVDYLGFKIGKEFVVGYGIDYAGKFRGLPYVGYLENSH